MPNRILREGILTSPKVAKLGWAEEVLYRRLMSLVDDYGRYFASTDVLRGHAYPRQINKVSDSDLAKWLRGCVDAGLVRVYPAEDGESYLEIVNFGQQVRATKSKFPAPPAIDSNCLQVKSNECLDVSVFVSESVTPAGPDLFEVFWEKYPKKKAKDDARKAFAKRKPDQALVDAMVKAIDWQSKTDQWLKDGGQFIPFPATWLNDGRWQDEQTTATVTVPSKPGRDPALEKIEADALKAAPIPAEVREFASRLKAKTRTADTARAF